MTNDEMILWLTKWCAENNCTLSLSGSCGFGRPCVGILCNGHYPDYEDDEELQWIYDDEKGEILVEEPTVWRPDLAYHKHPCVAVLGQGEESIAQLYRWVRWFDENEYTVTETFDKDKAQDAAYLIFGLHQGSRMIKKEEVEND